MLTFNHSKGYVIYNSDLSGDVTIINEHREQLAVSGPMLLSFVANHVRNRRIAALEQAEDWEILGYESK